MNTPTELLLLTKTTDLLGPLWKRSIINVICYTITFKARYILLKGSTQILHGLNSRTFEGFFCMSAWILNFLFCLIRICCLQGHSCSSVLLLPLLFSCHPSLCSFVLSLTLLCLLFLNVSGGYPSPCYQSDRRIQWRTRSQPDVQSAGHQCKHSFIFPFSL